MKKLPLNIREWTCPSCSATLDRDLNAAINLEKWYREFHGNRSEAPKSVEKPLAAEQDCSWSTSNASTKQKESSNINIC